MNKSSKNKALLKNKASVFLAKIQKDELIGEVTRNVGGSLTVKIIGMGLSFLLQVVLARSLGLEGYGDYIYVWTWANLLSLIGRLGFNVAAIRFVAEYKEKEQWRYLKGFLSFTNRVVWGVSIITTLMLAFVIDVLVNLELLSQHLVLLFWLALPLLPAFAIMQVQDGILRGAGQVISSLTLQIILLPSIMGIVVYSSTLFGSITAATAVFINLVSLIIVIIGQQIIIRRQLSSAFATTLQPTVANREWLNTSMSMFLTSGAQETMRRLDVLLIGSLLGSRDVGIYAVSIRLMRLVQLGLQATNTASAHMFARLKEKAYRQDLQRVVFLTAKLTFISTIPAIFILYFWASEVMLLFGESFVNELSVMKILLLGELVNVFSGPNGLLMNMTGRHKELGWILIITLFVDASLLWFLIHYWGIVGAAIATTVTISIRNLITVVRVWQHLQVNPTVFSLNAWLPNRAI